MQYFPKNIACIESIGKMTGHRSPTSAVLEYVSSKYGNRFSLFSCGTLGEFKFTLEKLAEDEEHQVLQLVFPGDRGGLLLSDGTRVTLEELAGIMQHQFEGRIVHLTFAGVLNVGGARVQDFVAATRVLAVLGFKKDAEAIEASAMDLLLLSYLQEYKDIASMWRRLAEHYPDLMRRTGLQIIASD